MSQIYSNYKNSLIDKKSKVEKTKSLNNYKHKKNQSTLIINENKSQSKI